jgi:hypothetical protein
MMMEEIADQGKRYKWPLNPSHPHLRPYSSLPTHLGLRIRDCPRRQKLLHHRRMPVPRSQMQRRGSILRRAAGLNQAHPVSAQVNAFPPTPVTLSVIKPRQGKTEMERNNSLPAKPKRHKKLVRDSQTFALMARGLKNSFLFLRVMKMKKKVHAFLKPPPTLATLFTTPATGPKREPKETQSLSCLPMKARRVAFWTLVQSSDPPNEE